MPNMLPNVTCWNMCWTWVAHAQVYPAHDYKGRTQSSIIEERLLNPRLTKPKLEFVQLMQNLGLAYPKKMDVSVPANLMCGVPEP